MILVSQKFMTPRTSDVITLQDSDGDYIYLNRSLYDTAVVFDYTTQGDTSRMDASVLGDKLKTSVNEDVLALMLDIYVSAPEPINMLIPFMMVAENIAVPGDLKAEDKKEFAYNLLDIITNSIDVRSYVKLPTQLRSSLTGIQHLVKTYKERTAHTMAMWFTGIEIVPIHTVTYSEVPATVVNAPIPTATAVPTEKTEVEESKPLPIPIGSVTSVPAADKETATPVANTISEEEFEELQRMLAAEDEIFEEKIKEKEKKSKQVEVPKEVKDKAEINSIFEDTLAGL